MKHAFMSLAFLFFFYIYYFCCHELIKQTLLLQLLMFIAINTGMHVQIPACKLYKLNSHV